MKHWFAVFSYRELVRKMLINQAISSSEKTFHCVYSLNPISEITDKSLHSSLFSSILQTVRKIMASFEVKFSMFRDKRRKAGGFTSLV